MKFSLKIGLLFLFFCKVIVKWKWKLRSSRGVIEDFKRKWEKKKKKEKQEKNFFLIKKIIKIYENEN